MKIILLWSMSCMSFLFSCDQKKEKTKTAAELPEIFNTKYVRLIGDTNHLMMIENVVIRFGDLYAEADSARYDKPEQTVTLYSIRKLSFKGDTLKKSDYVEPVVYTKGKSSVQ